MSFSLTNLDIIRKSFHLSKTDFDLSQITHIMPDEEFGEQVGIDETSKDRIWHAVEQLYKTGTQPAITVCLRKNGRILLHRSIGHAQGNGPDDQPHTYKEVATADMPVCLYSASKAVTALIMHKMAEQGAVNLLDPVSFYLPEFAKHGKANITLHQILSHRGGIPGLPKGLPLDTIYDEARVWELLCDSKPITVDGSKLAYHAISGGFVFQQVVKKVMGTTIDDYLDEHFRRPMDMKYFTFGLDEEHRDQVAKNYATGPNAPFPMSWLVKRALGASFPEAATVSNDYRWMDCTIPAANLYSSAEEISRFYQMLLNKGEWNGKQILEPETVIRATQPFGECSFDRTMMIPMRYSAGLMLGGKPFGMWGQNTENAYGHIGLINKMCWADPDKDISVAILTTGLALASHHIPYLVKLMNTINQECA
ncbi:serine hydrolase domain-containing protein [Litoribrevibacter albus]|uniref:EstA family serine hydrolase n=1 Tax=Litoribrevibacter albus TaxID=1473156 RepID=A0AA37S8K1_9GAMM|nr:serine hydrolase domain-containing protein [Litoribrevibacter albus]GLQ30167.1 EstA family serine hydrolase [Litoribrevibacter albus]